MESELSLKAPILIPSGSTQRKLEKLRSSASGFKDLEKVGKLQHVRSERVLTTQLNKLSQQPAPAFLKQ